MKILSVDIQNLRNLSSVNLDLEAGHNLLVGDNGAGKTSVLEAVHLLGYGRSFRSRQAKDIIQSQQSELVVSCRFLDSQNTEGRAGVRKTNSGESDLRLNGVNLGSTSELATNFPVVAIESSSFDLLDGGPKERRRVLDWGVFHVEHGFSELWKSYRRVLSQRNAQLKVSTEKKDFVFWNQELDRLSKEIDQLRSGYFERFTPLFFGLLSDLAPEIASIDFQYKRGWSADIGLEQALESSFSRDVFERRTTRGCHTADLSFAVEGIAARDCLSRGQKKILVIAFKCAQASLYNAVTENSCVLLLDDLASELDANKWQRVLEILDAADCQTLQTYTELDKQVFAGQEQRSYKLFHVKQGKILPVNN